MVQIPYTRQTWTDGASALSAARMAVLENGIYEVSYAPAVRVYHNANQSINTDTSTVLAFNSERFDTTANAGSTMHDNVTDNSRLTCRYAGKYQISACIRFASNSTGVRQVTLKLNGTTTIARQSTSALNGLQTDVNVSCLYDLAVNDYVQVEVYQTSGSGLNVEVNANDSPEFMMARVA